MAQEHDPMSYIKRSEHGSRSLEEFVARMREAGYEDWEIEDEVEEMTAIAKLNRETTEKMAAEHAVPDRRATVAEQMTAARAAAAQRPAKQQRCTGLVR